MCPRESKAETQTDICTPMFIIELFTVTKGENNLGVPQQMNG